MARIDILQQRGNHSPDFTGVHKDDAGRSSSAVCRILHHLQERVAVLRQLGLSHAADLPHFVERVRLAVQYLQQGAVVEDDVRRHFFQLHKIVKHTKIPSLNT